MDFNESENQRMIKEMVKDFAEKEIRPNVMRWDEAQEFPVPLFKKLGELGLMGVFIPEEYGGSGMNYHEYISVIVEISKVCGSIGLSVAAHNSLCTGHIYYNANEEQKKKYLPKLATAEWIGAWGLTETGTGSDAGGMNTTAVKDGDHWILNGSKNFITHGKSGDVAVVIVRTGEKGDSHGMSAFIIEKGTEGFSAGKKEDKMGMRASETTELIFNNCRVHKDQMIGEEGTGFVQAMKVLDGGRISIGALALGIAKGAYEAALQYSKEREQFGKPICEHQAIAFKLADMATKIEAADLLLAQAADLKNRGEKLVTESAMAKMYASEIACEVCNDAVQIYGGYGYVKEFPVEKFYRDVKLCTIGEGTTQIQQLVISRNITK
ncbi:MAG: alkylation response protein AidB-like acyl-CoA dehydrogenase [Flavobacteriales bacterium]|jgi:alkylation response protein AidB-like acyl-CoA dehydrogenase|tara:strand:- start:4877 stop:6016 length:1140 start_codon:yes stop_codon:yes gene_type:complete